MLTVGTLSDAPPSICINSQGQFTGFDNELLRAIAEKLGLRVNFVGTEFSGLLAQVARDASTSARRRSPPPTPGGAPSDSPTATTSATSRWWCRPGRRSRASTSSPRASASASCRAPCRRPTSSTPCTWIPVKFPDYNTVYASLKTRQIDAWVAPSQQAQGTVQAGDPAVIVENTFSLDNFVGLGGRQGEQAADRRAQLRAGRGHRRRHLVAAVLRLGAARAAARLEAWLEGGAAAATAGFRGHRRQPASRALGCVCRAAEVDDVAAGATRSSTGTSTGRRSPTCSRPVCRTR